MRFADLAQACLASKPVPTVTDLLHRKAEAPELGVGKRIDVLNGYIEASIAEFAQHIQALPDEPAAGWYEPNALFLRTLRSSWKR